MQSTIDNTQDVLDSREIIGRIEEREAERKALVEEVEAAKAAFGEDFDLICPPTNTAEQLALDAAMQAQAIAEAALANWDEDHLAELDALKSLAEQGSCSPDWQYGETLVRDSYFTTYAEELAEDCCMLDRELTWPYTCIDWDRAASDLKMDYHCVDFDGIDYWIRA